MDKKLILFHIVDFDSLIPLSQSTENNYTHYIGKQWRIDCRIKDNAAAEVKLYQDGILRKPDGRVLILKDQVFTLLSENASDIGEYSCEYCNKRKTVGNLVAGTEIFICFSFNCIFRVKL